MATQNLLNNNIHVHKLTNDKQCQIQNRYFIWQLSVLGSCWFDYRINASQASDSPHQAAEWRQEVTNNSCHRKNGPCTRWKGLFQQQ